jgi:hypothetical protein
MIATASRLLDRAQQAGAIQAGVTPADVFALANVVVLATGDA